MQLLLKALLSIAAATLLVDGPAHAQADTWPDKPVRLVIPYPPGGLADSFARALAEGLSKRLKQPVISDNRPGASLIIGTDAVAKAPPDGYTLLLGSVSGLGINPAPSRSCRTIPSRISARFH